MLFLGLMMNYSCKDDEGNNNNNNNNPDNPDPVDSLDIDFGCIYQYDANGNSINNCSDDEWHTNYTFNDTEIGLLDFGDTLDLQGILMTNFNAIRPYPNPASDVIYFYYNIDADAYMKMVFLDADANRVLIWSGLLQGDQNAFGLNVSGLGTNYYRVYYSLNEEGNENYAGGYGDIRIEN